MFDPDDDEEEPEGCTSFLFADLSFCFSALCFLFSSNGWTWVRRFCSFATEVRARTFTSGFRIGCRRHHI